MVVGPRRTTGVPVAGRFVIAGPAGRLAGSTWGSRRTGDVPILYIHPINLQGSCWSDVAEAVRPSHFSLMPDLRGHGASAAAGPYDVEAWAADCIAVLDHFGVEEFHAVGGSLGGPIAVYLAATLPDRCRSIASFGGALRIEGADVDAVLGVLREKGVSGMFRDVIPRISVAPDTAPEVIERILSLTNPNGVDEVWTIWKATTEADVTTLASRVSCPALIANGEHDLTCTPEQGGRMARALNTHLVTIPGLGHLPMLEAPTLTADLISTHLAGAGCGRVP